MTASVKQSFKQQPWKVICLMVALALLWPLSKAFGLTDDLPLTYVVAGWFAIRAIWILIVVFRWVGDPVWTLTLASGIYGLITVIPQQINMEASAQGRVAGAVANVVSMLIVGVLLGVIAKFFQRLHTNR